MHVRGPGARVLELGEGGEEGELTADAAVDVGQRRQPEAGARGVELAAAELQAAGDGALGTTPQRAPERGAGEAGAERVDRKVRFAVWINVGDERGERQLLELGGERGYLRR